MNKITKIIQQSIDIHMHIGPEPIPRKYTVQELVNEEKGNIAGFVLKNHFYSTLPFIKEVRKNNDIILFGGIVLNNAIGGLNSEAILATRLLTADPIVVWFPTINAENFLKQSKYEIAPEWINKKSFKARKATEVDPVFVTKKGKLTKETISVLKAIREHNAVLATGHIASVESVLLVDQALKLGIKRIVITHPIYQRINMSISMQRELANKGCFIEIPYSMHSIDGISITEIARQIKQICSKSIILSSDVGQTFSPSSSKSLSMYATLLNKEGITYDQLFQMLVTNPKKLLSSK